METKDQIAFREHLNKYQLYRHLPDLGWMVFGVNVHPLKGEIFFDLLLYSAEYGKIAPVLVNKINLGENAIEVPSFINSLKPAEIVQLYETAIATMYRRKQEFRSPNSLFMLQNIPGIQSLMNNVNPQRRSVPGMSDLVNTLKPIQHYRDVRELIEQRRKPGTIKILDCGCGAGYGSLILGELTNSEVVGADVDDEAVQIARMLHLGERNILFQRKPLEEKAKNGERFDYLVSLETMEHVEHPRLFLEAALELLQEEGSLFLSVPHWRFHGTDLNSDHRTNWTLEKLTALFQRYFQNFQILVSEVSILEQVFTSDYSFKSPEQVPLDKIEQILVIASKKDLLRKSFSFPKKREPLRILFVNHSIPPYEYTGTPIVTANQMESLNARGHQVAALIPRPEAGNFLIKETINGNIIYKVPPLNWTQAFLEDAFWGYEVRGYLNLIEKAVRDFKPDIININDYVFMTAKMVELFEAMDIPIVRQVHAYEELCFKTRPFVANPSCKGPGIPEKCAECILSEAYRVNSLFSIRQKSIYLSKLYARFAYIKALFDYYDVLVFGAESWANHFLELLRYPKDKATVVPIGIEFAVPRPQRVSRKNASPTLAFIGTIARAKGIDLLMMTFLDNEVLKEDFHMFIFGAIAEKEAEKWLAELQEKSNHKVVYKGSYRREELPSLLKGIDLGILPYYCESYSVATREFLYLGIPVIASRTFGITDIIKEEKNGLLFEVGNREELKAKVLRVLRNPEILDQLKNGALRTHIPNLQEEAARLEEIYYKVVEKHSTH